MVSLRRFVEHPWRLGVALALLATLLCTPGLEIGFVLDDHAHRVELDAPERLSEMARSPADLFAFVGEHWSLPDDFKPWWHNEDLRIAFFRPLAGFTHGLDHRLWPDEPRWMHLHSLLWFALMIFAATQLYRCLCPLGGNKGGRLCGPDEVWIAGFAALVFAVDDAHGMPAVWIANRNALMATFFGLVALIAYHRRRREGWRPGSWVAPLALLLAVLSGEIGVGCGAYLLAYALFLDRGPWRERLTALVPCATVGIVWQVAYRALGYGSAGSAFYIDPGTEPSHFLAAVVERVPVLLWGQLGYPPGDIYNLLSQSVARQAWLVVTFLLVLFGLFLLPLLRREPLARFWTCGMLLALVPMCTTLPIQRLLFYAGIGGAGLMAMFIVRAWHQGEETLSPRGDQGGETLSPRGDPRGETLWRFTARALTVPLILVHLVLAPWGLWGTAGNMVSIGAAFDSPFPDAPAIREQQAWIVQAPAATLATWTVIYRVARGEAVPATTLTLGAGLYAIEVHRPNARALTLRPDGGFLMPPGSAPPGQTAPPMNPLYMFQVFDLLNRADRPFVVGQRIERERVSVEIVEVTENSRPAAVTFHFDAELEDAAWLWLRWQNGRFVPWQPLAVGETITLPAPVWGGVSSPAPAQMTSGD